MTATSDKYALLVDRLVLRTEGRKLDWKYDEASDTLSTEIGERFLSITKGYNNNGEPVVRIGIGDALGNEIDHFTDDHFIGRARPGGFNNYYNYMLHLRDIAMRQATGAEDALDDLLKDLEE